MSDVNRRSKSKNKFSCPPEVFRQHSLFTNHLVSANYDNHTSHGTFIESRMKVQRYMHLKRTKSAAMMNEIKEKDKLYISH